MECVDENTLAAFFEGRLDDHSGASVEVHLDVCEPCRTVLAMLVRAPERSPNEPTRIGRYEVLGILGQGGMGIVHLARDTELGRRVAVKLVRPGEDDQERDRRTRLLREAQTMARLSHPNVAQVYDAGALDDGQVFVALEYVEGNTLAGWMRRTRPWRECVDVMIAAGRGLAAAHAAGIVHRDFKPSNVLVGRDGRVRVADFGLARGVLADPDDAPQPARFALGTSITGTGALLGSPAYMAPEQLARTGADERSDQFSFAVTLYEALYGKRPFEGANVAELASAIEAGPRAEPAHRAPAALRRIVRRGLQRDPAARYPSIDAMVQDLERAKRRPRILFAAAGVAIAATAGIAFAGFAGESTASCQPPNDRVARAWGPPRREAISRAFAATNLPYAKQASGQVLGALDAYAKQWTTAHVDACKAARGGETSPAVLDRRMLCLDHRLHDLAALANTLSGADASVVRYAVRAASALPAIDACADLASVMARIPPPEATVRPTVEALRQELAVARSLRYTGRYPDADRTIAPLLARAREVAYAPLVGEVLLELGEIRTKVDDAKGAMTAFDEAAHTAYAAGDDAVAARAWIAIVYAAGYSHADPATGDTAAKLAKAALARMPADDRLLGQLAAYEGVLLHARGDYAAALERYEAARAAFDRLTPKQPELEASLRNALANTQAALGKPALAVTLLREAIAIREQTLGPAHPDTAVNRANLGTMLSRQGLFDDALVELDRATADVEKSLGPRHPDVANYLANSCAALEALGRLDEALARARRTLAIYEAAVGADDPRTLQAMTLVAKLLASTGKPTEAVPIFERALELQEKRLGPKHPSLATTLNNLAQAHADRGNDAEAIAAYTRALGIAEAALGPDHRRLAYSLVGLGEAHTRQREWDVAITTLRRALAILEQTEADPASLGEARIKLADALWKSKRDRAAARVLANEARAAFETAKDAAHAAEVDRWLTAHD